MRIEISSTKDEEFIREVVMSVWDETCEDGADRNAWAINPIDTWLEIKADGRRIGAYCLHPWNGTTLEVHAQILPTERKKYTYDVSKACYHWVLDHCNASVQKLIAFIPDKYPNVARYAIKSGWVEEGILEASWRRDGILYDIYVMGMTRDRMKGFL